MKNPWKQILFLLPILVFIFLCGFLTGRSVSSKPIVSTVITARPAQKVGSMDQSDEKLIININTATVRELTLLPDIGESLAQRIVDYRREKGPFPDCDSLLNIPGIGPGTLSKILPYIIAGG